MSSRNYEGKTKIYDFSLYVEKLIIIEELVSPIDSVRFI